MAALQPAALGTLGFAAFPASMTIGRWFADGALGRYGRVAVIRGQTVLAVAGVLIFVFSPTAPPAGSAWSPRSATVPSSAALP